MDAFVITERLIVARASTVATETAFGAGMMPSGRLRQKPAHWLELFKFTSVELGHFHLKPAITVISTSVCVNERLTTVSAAVIDFDFAAFAVRLPMKRTD